MRGPDSAARQLPLNCKEHLVVVPRDGGLVNERYLEVFCACGREMPIRFPKVLRQEGAEYGHELRPHLGVELAVGAPYVAAERVSVGQPRPASGSLEQPGTVNLE